MPRTCTICSHPDRDAVEHAIVSGGSIRRIAAQFGLTPTSVRRHMANHLPAAAVAEAQDADRDRA
jgi:transposase-like protein